MSNSIINDIRKKKVRTTLLTQLAVPALATIMPFRSMALATSFAFYLIIPKILSPILLAVTEELLLITSRLDSIIKVFTNKALNELFAWIDALYKIF